MTGADFLARFGGSPTTPRPSIPVGPTRSAPRPNTRSTSTNASGASARCWSRARRPEEARAELGQLMYESHASYSRLRPRVGRHRSSRRALPRGGPRGRNPRREDHRRRQRRHGGGARGGRTTRRRRLDCPPVPAGDRPRGRHLRRLVVGRARPRRTEAGIGFVRGGRSYMGSSERHQSANRLIPSCIDTLGA